MRRTFLTATMALAAVAAIGSGVSAAGQLSTRTSCGGATPLKMERKTNLGPVVVSGFSSKTCARISLRCRPEFGGHQSSLTLNVAKAPTSPIVLRGSTRSGTVKFALVGSRGPIPKMPRCLHRRNADATAALKAPNITYVLVVFPPKGAHSFRLTARQGGRLLGTVTVGIASAS